MSDPVVLPVSRIAPDGRAVDYGESLELAEFINAQSKECYYNAIVGLVGWARGAPDTDKFYVEGVALDPLGIPMEHGWIQLSNRILDPTWARLMSEGQMQAVRYFPAIRYTVQDILDAVSGQRCSGRALRLPMFMYPPGKGSVDYTNPHIAAALDAAHRFVFGDAAIDALLRREAAQ